MKHVEAGLVVGGIACVIGLCAATVWWLMSMFVGQFVAAIFVAAVIAITVGAIILDYRTEKE